MGKKEKRPLWAPWRIDFIVAPRVDKCFLCGKKNDFKSNDEGLVVRRGKGSFTILNRYPYNSGHLMIAPYRHVNDLLLLRKNELHELIEMAVDAEKMLRKLMHPDGFNIGFNLGASAGAGHEEHIHLHVVPRWKGDTNFMPVLGDTRVVPQALGETAEYIRKGWK